MVRDNYLNHLHNGGYVAITDDRFMSDEWKEKMAESVKCPLCNTKVHPSSAIPIRGEEDDEEFILLICADCGRKIVDESQK